MRVSTPVVFPQRPADGHKGTFGRVLVIAGSRGMSGAACLAGTAALRGGAGLVSVAIPTAIQSIVASYEPSYMTIGAATDPTTGQFSNTAVSELLPAIETKDAIAIGPGLGTGDGSQAVVRAVLSNARQAVVIDADALNILASDSDFLHSDAWTKAGPRILTPHPGEFSRLTGLSIATIAADREMHAVSFAQRHRCVLLLKGHNTLITDGSQIAINTTGNSGMATGGAGDVLTGLIAALLGQGLFPFDAARTGAYWHGLAGDLAADELSQPSLIASDLPKYLGVAYRSARG